MALAQSGRPDEQDVLGPRHKLAGRHVEDLRLRQLGVELEVEVLERADPLEARAPDALVDLLVLSPVDLVLKQAQEKLDVGHVILDGLTLPKVEGLEDAAESQLLEDREQVIKLSHSTPPGERRA